MTPESLAARLFREPFAFDFFQAVRLLEAVRPARTPVGLAGPPGDEVVTFAAQRGEAFPASQIDRLEPGGDGPPRMTVTFFGLTGPSGVLPPFYTHQVVAQLRAADNPERKALAAWFDLFNHRLLSLFHRAGTKYRLPFAFERAARGRDRDPVTAALLSVVGLGTPGLAGRVRAEPTDRPGEPAAVDDLSLVWYAGLFAPAARSAAGLEGLLADYFGVPVAVEQFRGHWLTLSADNQTRLGRRRGANDQLGTSLVVGRRVWDAQGCFRVRVGPLGYADFTAFLPDRAGGRRKLVLLAQLVRFYARDGLDFEVQLVLRGGEVPPLRLTRDGDGPRLGWNTWLGRRPGGGDADEPVFRRERLVGERRA